jgi:hypothetical protein
MKLARMMSGLAYLTAAAGAAHAADWRFVTATAETAVYIDAETVSREGSRVRYLENVIFIVPLTGGATQRISLISADCTDRSFQTIERTFFQGDTAGETQAGTDERRQASARSLNGRSIAAACAASWLPTTIADPRVHARGIAVHSATAPAGEWVYVATDNSGQSIRYRRVGRSLENSDWMRIELRLEYANGLSSGGLTIRSSFIPAEVDCAGRRFRLLEGGLYTGANLTGDGYRYQGEQSWRNVEQYESGGVSGASSQWVPRACGD